MDFYPETTFLLFEYVTRYSTSELKQDKNKKILALKVSTFGTDLVTVLRGKQSA